MEAREKAEELMNGFRIMLLKNSDPMNMTAPFNYTLASRECALICVGELIKSHSDYEQLEYWKHVAKEIEKL